jgi:hypothetical protein
MFGRRLALLRPVCGGFNAGEVSTQGFKSRALGVYLAPVRKA